MNLNPKYAKRLQKYVESDSVTINRNDLDHTLGDLLLASRLKKQLGCPKLSELHKYIK